MTRQPRNSAEEDDWEEDDFGEEHEAEEDDEEFNMRMYGIQPALPIPEGDPDWDAGACLVQLQMNCMLGCWLVSSLMPAPCHLHMQGHDACVLVDINTGEPQTVEEYLRRVRAEAAACPRVVRVEFDPSRVQPKRSKPNEADTSETGTPGTADPVSSIPTSINPSTSVPTTAATPGSQGHDGSCQEEQGSASARQDGRISSAPRRAPYVQRLVEAGSLPKAATWAQPSQGCVPACTRSSPCRLTWLALCMSLHFILRRHLESDGTVAGREGIRRPYNAQVLDREHTGWGQSKLCM